MTSDLRIQGEVVVNSEQAEGAFNRVGDKAQQMANEVATSAGKAGQAVDKIGDGAGASAEKFTRAESRISASIKRATNELELLGKTASQRLEFNIADKGLDPKKFEPALQKLREVEAQAQAAQRAASGSLDKMGISAAQTAAALRGVPAQFTDIVTSLQGGQAPLTVFLQQGGQLKDMFGGVGAAARALGGYVLGLINPFTLAAAAVGAIALAYNQGSKEQDAFVKSIVTTGNISGVTAGQLGQYARAISSVAGTQSKAAETLAAFVAEGVRGGAMLERYAQTAIEWEKATGQSVAKTAEQFASLQKDPLSSVLKLNEGTNFLTDSVYKQIKALDEQGRSADASKVAMDALNTAMESRSKTIEQNLGYIESAWRGITSAAKKAWDAMLNVGRAETGASQLASLRETLDQRMQRGPINDMPSTRAAWEKGNEGLRKQIDLLAEQERMLRRGAEAESERNKQLAARIEFDKSGEQYLSKRARMEREIAKATNEAAAAGVGQAELEQRIASIREKFAEKNTAGMKAQRAAAKLLADDLSALAKMAGLSPDFYKEWEKLGDMFKRGKLDVDGLTQAQAKLLKKQPVIAAETKAQADAQKQVNASIDAYRSALQAVAKEEAARVDGIAKSNADLREQIATMGLTNQQIRARTIELNRATIAEKEQQLARLQTGYTNTREQAALEEEIRLLKERNGLLSDQGVKEQYVAAQQEMTDTWTSIDRTAHDVFVNIFEDGAGTFKRLGQTLKAALLDMLYQMTVKRWIINIGASLGATGGIFAAGNAVAGQGGGGTNLLGGLGNLFGGSAAGAGGFGGFMGLGSFGSGFGAGLGALFGEAGLMGGLSAGATAIGAGNILGGLGTLAGVAAPILGPLALLGLSGAFSRKHEQHNLQGTFGGASGFEGKWHDYYRGGLLTSSKTDDLPIDSATLNALRAAWKAQEAAVTDYAQTLGLATDKISGFTYAVNLKLKDLGDPNAEGYMAKVMQRVTEALAAGSDELAQQILGTWTETTETVKQTIWTLMGGDEGWANVTTETTATTRTYAPSEYQREGEKAIDTLARLATSLKTVNGVFDTLGLTMMETSLAGGDLASKVVDQFGGKDAFAALTSSYYDAYYSDDEKRATLQRQVTEQMAKLGQTLPTTRDEFRALIEAQDLSTDAGQKMFAALMALNPAFAQLTETAQAASPAVQSAADLLKRQNELLADQARLQADLMAARGDTTGAAAARRALDTGGYSDAERAIYDANQALSEQIELEKQRLELLRQQQAIQADLMAARGDSAGAQALRRELATVGFSDTAKAIYDANTALTAQIDLEKQRLDLLRQQQSIQADLMETAGDIAGAQALRRELATVGFSEAALAIYDANQALRDQIAAIQQFSGIVGGIGNSLASLIQDGLLGNLSAADLGGRMADVVIGGVYNAMASGFSQQITSLLMNGLVTPMVQAALVGTSVSEAVSRAAIDKMMAQATAVAQALGAVLSDPAFRAAMAQVEGIMSGLAAAMAPAQAYYVNWDTRQQEAQRAAQEAQRLADQQAQEAQRLAQQAAQEAQRAADEEARRQQGIMNERLGLTKQLLQLEGNTVLLRQIELEALDPSNRALQQRIWAIEDETAAAEKYKSALKDAQDFLGGFTRNIEEFIFKVSHAQADAAQGYQMAAAKFSAQLVLARGGDRDAMGGITSYADTLIGSIRRESTTGAEANLRIARVLGQLASLPKQISAEQLIVDAIVNANTSLETVLSTNFASLDANVDGLLTAGELAASGLATNTQISALMARVDANGDGMISKQELANSRLQTLSTAQTTANTSLGSITSAQNSTNSWLSQIQMADVGYSLSNVNAINSSTSATVAAINKTNAQIGTFNRNYDNPVTAQFSADSPLYSIFKGIDETNTWLYKLHGLSTASIQFWIALLNNNAPVTVRSENRTPANGTVFADGGYTGPGAKWQPAGVVHKGEVVWSQVDVARWGGPGIVDALRQGAPGYADGGPVAVRVPQIYVPPVGRSNEETQALLREVLAELRAQRSDDRARHSSLAEPLQRMDRRGAKWDRDGLPAERTNEAIA